jgi:putative flippase GtrA
MAVTHRPLRYLVAGLWNTAVGYGTYLACDAAVRAVGGHYLLALFPAQILSTLQAYVVHRAFVFSDATAGVGAFLRYNLVYWIIFAANLLVLPALVELTHLDPRIAQAVFIAASTVTSYLGHRLFSFRAAGA